jgi:hypothetical protein
LLLRTDSFVGRKGFIFGSFWPSFPVFCEVIESARRCPL